MQPLATPVLLNPRTNPVAQTATDIVLFCSFGIVSGVGLGWCIEQWRKRRQQRAARHHVGGNTTSRSENADGHAEDGAAGRAGDIWRERAVRTQGIQHRAAASPTAPTPSSSSQTNDENTNAHGDSSEISTAGKRAGKDVEREGEEGKGSECYCR